MRGGIAERGGVRVGHKIIEMNGESVVTASHHHIVDVLQTTIGEVRKSVIETQPAVLETIKEEKEFGKGSLGLVAATYDLAGIH